MGHANLSNLSDFFVKRLFAKGKLSINDCVQAMLKKGETYNASECAYEEESMLSMGTEEAVSFLREFDAPPGNTVLDKMVSAVDGKFTGPIIVPVSLSAEQRRILVMWPEGEVTEPEEYEALDSIQWKYAPGWRNKYPEIPRLGRVTH